MLLSTAVAQLRWFVPAPPVSNSSMISRPALAVLSSLLALSTTTTQAAAPNAFSQDSSSVLVLDASRIDGPPVDASWAAATPLRDFVQREPTEGGVPSQRTEVRVLYDATTLHVQVRAFDDQPDKLLTYLTRRDGDCPCDWIRVLIDSYRDRRTAYEFAVNPSGVKQDAYWYNDSSRDGSWDAVWDVEVTRNADGWVAEFRIPFSQLRFKPAPSTTFGFAVSRQMGRVKETATWPLLARSATGYVSSFGELRGLHISASPHRLELLPYAVGDMTKKPAGSNPLIHATSGGLALGLDAKYALTSGLTLATTVNPEFGQVEADPAVVNLSAFETFFPERRPFFVEGSGAFAFGLDCGDCTGLFYSRRIGRPPQGVSSLPSGAGVYTAPFDQTTILGAAKLSGRVGRVAVGALHAVTQEERAMVLDEKGIRTIRPIEPLTNYSIVSARREFTNQSSIGLMATSTNRALPSALAFMSDRADSGGVNADWRFGRYSLVSTLAGSRITGSPDAIARLQQDSRHYFQRPDSKALRFDPLRTVLSGGAGTVTLGKVSGQRVRFATGGRFKSPGFDVNDLGFVQRADERSINNWLQIRGDEPTRRLLARVINVNQNLHWNYDGDLIAHVVSANGYMAFKSNIVAGGGLNLNRRFIDDRLSRGGPAGLVEGITSAFAWVETDERLPIHLNVDGSLGRDGHGTHFTNLAARLTLRPSPPLNVTIGARLNRAVTDAQWLATVTDMRDHSVFGHLNQTTVAMTWRASYTMSPDMSLQLYAEPFVSAGEYSRFRELVDGRASTYGQRYASFQYTGDPGFNVQSFRTTNVFRWEYRPGSTLFVVWQQARDGSGDLPRVRLGRDVRDLFGAPGTNVLLVKFAYWLNF